MVRRLTLVALLVILLVSGAVPLAGCSEPKETATPTESTPPAGSPAASPAESPAASPAGSPAAGMRLAPGLHDLEGGKVQALGTLEWRDLEGGFWVVLDGTKAEGDEGATLAVIANPGKFADTLESLKDRQVVALGTRLDGASIRMAGPEIEIDSIEEVTDTPGAAE